MADYYPLVARAVAGLERNTGEARRALYERARTALVTQLRGVTPPLEENQITRERLSLEEAIRKVEAEVARRPRTETPPRPAPVPATAASAPHSAQPVPPLPPRQPAPAVADAQAVPAPQPQRPAPPPAIQPQPRPPSAPRPAPPSSLPDDGLGGLRPSPVTADAPPLQPPAQPAAARRPPPPRDPLAGLPTAYDFDQHQPILDPETLHAPPPDFPQGHGHAESLPPGLEREPMPEDAAPAARMPLALGALIKVAISVIIVVTLGMLAYWQRGTVVSLYQAFRGPAAPVARDAPPPQERPKIGDRVGPGAAGSQPGGAATPAVAQRVVLYEEEANDPQGKRYLGSVIWRTETVSPGPGKPPELAVRAEVEIPERHINMTFSLRQNTDPNLPASHTVEIMFNLPADFPAGGIANVPGILMKQAEQTRGTPLAGLAVKVTSGFFLIGLSAVESDRQRNIELLKERAWFDVPIVYTNNRRAILAIEKGTPGERAFAEAFAAWKQ